MESLKRFLNELEFFKGLDPAYLDLLVGCASNVRFSAGEFLFHEGEKADNFYVIRSGRVTVEQPLPGFGSLTIQTLSEGDVVGWSWLFEPHMARINIKSQHETRALAFDGSCLRGKCEENHDLGYELMRRFSHVVISRLQATRLQLVEVCKHPANLVM
jgi:CRP-like cAMP-binding protein